MARQIWTVDSLPSQSGETVELEPGEKTEEVRIWVLVAMHNTQYLDSDESKCALFNIV